jgi:hypothetical protein
MTDGKRPRIWAPGIAYVTDESEVTWGKHVGYNGWGKSFRLSPVGHFGSIRDWRHRAWLVERAHLTQEIVDEHAIILAELLVDPDLQPNARRWLAEQPLVCVEGLKHDRLVDAGLRVFTIEHGVAGEGMIRIEANGGKRSSWAVEGRLHDLLPRDLRPESEEDHGRTEQVEVRTFVDRLLEHLTNGAVREIAVVNALAARSLIEPGYGYHGAPYGEAASIERVAKQLRALEPLMAQVYERAKGQRGDAVALGKELEGAPVDVIEVPVPVYGRALSAVLPPLDVDLDSGGSYTVGGERKLELVLPDRMRWIVEGVDPWSPRLPKDLRAKIEEEQAAPRPRIPGWIAALLVAVLVAMLVVGLLVRP